MYNLIEYCTAFSKTSRSLRQYYRDEGTKDTNDSVIDFPADNNNSDLFKFEQHITEKTRKGGIKNFEIMVALKYLSNFWRTLEMPLINCKIALQLTCSEISILASGTVASEVKCENLKWLVKNSMFLL